MLFTLLVNKLERLSLQDVSVLVYFNAGKVMSIILERSVKGTRSTKLGSDFDWEKSRL